MNKKDPFYQKAKTLVANAALDPKLRKELGLTKPPKQRKKK